MVGGGGRRCEECNTLLKKIDAWFCYECQEKWEREYK
jgi:hypothetical protein